MEGGQTVGQLGGIAQEVLGGQRFVSDSGMADELGASLDLFQEVDQLVDCQPARVKNADRPV